MKKMMTKEIYLTEHEVSDMLNVRRRTLQSWRYTNHGPRYVKLGGCVRYRESDLEAYLKGQICTTSDDH